MHNRSLSALIGELAINDAMETASDLIESRIDLTSYQNEIIAGITIVGEKYYHGKCFIADLMVAGMLAKDLFALVEEKGVLDNEPLYGKVIIGTIHNDIHDIGKNLIADALIFRGVNVIDLGVDVSVSTFVEAVIEHKPDILAISTIMDNTLSDIRGLVLQLFKQNLNKDMKIIVGGAAANERYIKNVNGIDLITSNFQRGINYCINVLRQNNKVEEINSE